MFFSIVPAAAARRLNSKTVFNRSTGKDCPSFLSPAEKPRFERLFELIEEGAESASDTFVGTSFFCAFTVSLFATRRTADDRVTLAFGLMLPFAVENTNHLVESAAHTGDALTGTDSNRVNPVLNLAQGLTGLYYAIYLFNIRDNSYTCYQDSSGDFPQIAGITGNLTEAATLYFRTMVHPEDRERVSRFADIATLPVRLRQTDTLACVYRRIRQGLSRGTFIVTDRDSDGSAAQVLYVIGDVNAEMAELPLMPDFTRRDPLTGVRNRLALGDMISMPSAYAAEIGVLRFETFDFDGITSRFGPEEASKGLVRTAALLSALFPDPDVVVRTGEAAFTVILQNATEKQSRPELRRKFEVLSAGLRHQLPDGSPWVLSGGLCFSASGYSPELYALAGQAAEHCRSTGPAGCALMDADGQVTAIWLSEAFSRPASDVSRSLFEAGMASLLRNTGNYAWIKDRDLTFAAASESFAVKLAGCRSAADIVGKSDTDLVSDPALADKYRREAEEQLKAGTHYALSHDTLTTTDGRTFSAETSRYLLQNEDGSVDANLPNLPPW